MMRVLMITQKVDLDDDILGFTHAWIGDLARGEVGGKRRPDA
jgi:hypothetical protein